MRRFADYLPKPISRSEIEASLANLPRLPDLKFDKNGRLLLYSFENKRLHFPLLAFLAFIGLSGYELVFNFINRTVFGAAVSLGLMICFGVLSYRNMVAMSKIVKRIYLKEDGKSILYTKIYDPKFKEVLIKSIRHMEQLSGEVKRIIDAEVLKTPAEILFLINYFDKRPYIYDQNLLDAIILGYDLTDAPTDQKAKEEDFEYA